MRFLLDEMYPRRAAQLLRDDHGHDAVHVIERGLDETDDAVLAEVARNESRTMVTENVVDFAGEDGLVLVFVLKRNLPVGGAQASVLTAVLDRWAHRQPRPYLGPHWPK